MRVGATISDAIDVEFRKGAKLQFGEQKGNLQKALEEAIDTWLAVIPLTEKTREAYMDLDMMTLDGKKTELGKIPPRDFVEVLMDRCKEKDLRLETRAKLLAKKMVRDYGPSITKDVFDRIIGSDSGLKVETFNESEIAEKIYESLLTRYAKDSLAIVNYREDKLVKYVFSNMAEKPQQAWWILWSTPFSWYPSIVALQKRKSFIEEFGIYSIDHNYNKPIGAIYGTKPYHQLPDINDECKKHKIPIVIVPAGIESSFWIEMIEQVNQMINKFDLSEKITLICAYPKNGEQDPESQTTIIREMMDKFKLASCSKKIMFVAIGNSVDREGRINAGLENVLNECKANDIQIVTFAGKSMKSKFYRRHANQISMSDYITNKALHVMQLTKNADATFLEIMGPNGSFTFDRNDEIGKILSLKGIKPIQIEGDFGYEKSFNAIKKIGMEESNVLTDKPLYIIGHNDLMVRAVLDALPKESVVNYAGGMDGTKFALDQIFRRTTRAKAMATAAKVESMASEVFTTINKLINSEEIPMEFDVEPVLISNI